MWMDVIKGTADLPFLCIKLAHLTEDVCLHCIYVCVSKDMSGWFFFVVVFFVGFGPRGVTLDGPLQIKAFGEHRGSAMSVPPCASKMA